MMKVNVTNSVIFVIDSIATSHIDDIEDDVADDMAMMRMATMICTLTWRIT